MSVNLKQKQEIKIPSVSSGSKRPKEKIKTKGKDKEGIEAKGNSLDLLISQPVISSLVTSKESIFFEYLHILSLPFSKPRT